ncbi:MAG: flagellin [Burkholderiaceae bacterium]
MSVINTNLKALVAQESMRSSDLKLSAAMERLSTGSRINTAKDDAAGLAISNRMTSQIRGMAKAIQNTNDAISMTQTAEGAYKGVNDILARMRELSVQSSTGTMNDNDRSSIQLEVAQLKSQIDDIATKTNHNNIKLLDGSAQKVVIQTGTNQGDTINLNFASARTKDIGVGTRATLASAGGQYVAATSFDALEDSAMYLNGVAIGASQALSDNASTVAASASAISKAAAINAKSELSGVYAKVDTNVVSGTGGMTAAALTGTITINGVTTDSFSTSAASTSLSRKATVTAINAKSEQTGVVAIDTEDDTLGVTLQAKDGRNIDIAFTTLTAVATGVRDTGTFVGSYNLYTLDSRSIDVSFQTGDQNVEAFSGLRNGSYASDTALFNTYKRATAAEATAPSDTTTGLLSNDSLIVNGVAIGQALATDDSASDTTAASSTREASAIAIAAAINRKTDLTGVTASASPNVIRGEGFTAGTSADVYLNGVTFTANAVTRNAVIDSFNDVSDRTGVVASAWGEGIELRAVDGRNISIGSATAANIGLTGIGIGSAAGSATAVTYYSQVTMQSDNTFEVKSGNAGIPNLELLGFRQGTFGGADNGLKINQVDVSTVSGANQAIVAIDAAIETISKSQANSGALNNRMDYIVANLAEASQNMSASRSRILDTDYATETSSLAKQQIISQAATAMLAQANQQPQSVLSLLK